MENGWSSGLRIGNFKGIEYFYNLEELTCTSQFRDWSDYLTASFSLDVSQNKKLRILRCSDNHNMGSLDVSGNPALTLLDCSGCDLTSLTVNSGIITLGCSQNNLSRLNLRNAPSLTELSCSSNSLTSLDLSSNTMLTQLYCSNNNIGTLNLTNNPSITELNCRSCGLTSLDVSNLSGLTRLNISGNNISSIDISHCPSLAAAVNSSTPIYEANCYTCYGTGRTYITYDGSTNLIATNSNGILGITCNISGLNNDISRDDLSGFTFSLYPSGNRTQTVWTGRLGQFSRRITSSGRQNGTYTISVPDIDVSRTYDLVISGQDLNGYSCAVSEGTTISGIRLTSGASTPVSFTCIYSRSVNYTVAFAAGADSGVSGMPSSQTVASGRTATQPADPVRTGYTFAGWYNGDTAYNFSNAVTRNITLTAHWTQNRVNVTYSANGINPTNMPSNTTVGYGDRISRPSNNPTAIGYTFDNWYTAASGGSVFDFNNPITTPATIYAHWLRNYTVTFAAGADNGVSGMPSSQTVASGRTATRPADPTRTGYTFAGWYNGDTQYTFTTAVTRNITLTAHWTQNRVSVTYSANGINPTNMPSNTTVGYGDRISRPSNNPTAIGYTFDNWYTAASGGSVFDFNNPITTPATIYAHWLRNYTVSFAAGAGSGVSGMPSSQTVASGRKVNEPSAPTRNGYTFVGWYYNGSEFDFNTPITGSITLTAQWSQNTTTVTYRSNIAATNMPSQRNVNVGSRITRPAVTPVAEGYTFDNWYTQASGGSVFNFYNPITSPTTIYAHWLTNYTVSFTAGANSGVSGMPSAQNVPSGRTATQPAAPVRTGYTFAGRYNGNTRFDFSTEIAGNITLTAHWTANTYTVTFSDGGRSNATGIPSAVTNVAYGMTVSEPETAPSVSGYTFMGWYNGNEIYDFDTPVTGNITLTAHWNRINNAPPTTAPTAEPTSEPTSEPTVEPGSEPSATTVPGADPTGEPASSPSADPTYTPVNVPETEPSSAPSADPENTPVPTSSQTLVLSASSEPGVAGFVERLYTVALGRSSDPVGKQNWIDAITLRGETGAGAARGFLYSPEFLNKDVSNEDFVRVLYRTFFDREPDQGGFTAWVDALNGGASKQDVIEGFINSTEWANLCLRYGISSGGTGVPNVEVDPSQGTIDFCTRLYTTCLNRNADANGLMAWARQLANQRDTGTGAARGFFFGEEFIRQDTSNGEYVTRLYRTFMGREPDEAGFNAWVSQLDSGVSREEVFNGFAQSGEFAGICASYGIMR